MRRYMKRIVSFSAILLHIVCNADYVTIAQPKQSWNAIKSDNDAKFDRQGTNAACTVYVSHPITFSTQHKPFRHHSLAPHYNLNHMSTEQLAWYFSAYDYTEGEILSHPMLYMNQAYLAIAKQLPRYPEFVEKYYKKYRTYKGFFKFWETIHFRYRKGLKKQFTFLYQECEKERVAQEVRERKDREERTVKECAARAMKEAKDRETYIRELARVENILSDGTACKRLSINNHKARLEKIKVSRQRPERKRRQLQTGQEALNFIAAYGITEQQVTRVTLNSYEYQLHKEFVSHIHSALALQRKHNLTDSNLFIDALGSGIGLGIKSNHLHNTEWATRWSDFCYEATEIIRGIGDGIVLGSYNTVDMVIHPVRTLVRIVDGVRMLGSLTARTVGTLAHWNYLIEHGEYLQCVTEMAAVGEQLTTMAANIKEATSQMSNRQIAKHVTAFGTEWALTGQMLAIGHTLCSNLGQTIKRTIKFLKDEGAAGEFALATTDGVLLKASENLNKSGGGVNNLIRNSNTILETVHAEYMARLETELESLRLLCDNKVLDTAYFGNKYLKPQYKHIFGIDLYFSRRGIPQISGFHHDLLQMIENSGVFQFTNKIIHESNFYSAKLYCGENLVKEITFFPSEWSREQVINKIYEAYDNFKKSGAPLIAEQNGKFKIQGVIKEGITIEMCITQKAEILTAYPLLK